MKGDLKGVNPFLFFTFREQSQLQGACACFGLFINLHHQKAAPVGSTSDGG